MEYATQEPTEDAIRDVLYRKPGKTRAYFSLSALRDAKESERRGYPVWKDVPHVMQLHDGDKDGISVPVTGEHRRMYPAEWQNFQDASARGWSLVASLPGSSPALVATMEELGIRYVEQLAERHVVAPTPMIRGVAAQEPEDGTADDEDTPDIDRSLPGLPEPLVKWKDMALRYLSLKAEAAGKVKPRLRVVGGHLEVET